MRHARETQISNCKIKDLRIVSPIDLLVFFVKKRPKENSPTNPGALLFVSQCSNRSLEALFCLSFEVFVLCNYLFSTLVSSVYCPLIDAKKSNDDSSESCNESGRVIYQPAILIL